MKSENKYAEIAKDVWAKPSGSHVFLKVKRRRNDKKIIIPFKNSSEAQAWVLERFDAYYDIKNKKQ